MKIQEHETQMTLALAIIITNNIFTRFPGQGKDQLTINTWNDHFYEDFFDNDPGGVDFYATEYLSQNPSDFIPPLDKISRYIRDQLRACDREEKAQKKARKKKLEAPVDESVRKREIAKVKALLEGIG